jgi:hypothetical protein
MMAKMIFMRVLALLIALGGFIYSSGKVPSGVWKLVQES